MHAFHQVDVFASRPHAGNPVAVVHGADGLTTEQMATFARWTNLSETTFLLSPTRPGADYRLRIFTPGAELPFAGHPTLGSAHAWLAAGGQPAEGEVINQECGVGIVPIRRGTRLAFLAPPLLRSGPVSDGDARAVVAALRVDPDRVVDMSWVDNGPGWVGVLLDSAQTVLDLRPDWAALVGWDVGVVGPYPGSGEDGGPACEVRAFCPGLGVEEDPVTGSLNAGLGQWLTASGRLPESYVAAQGTVLGRAGRVHVERVGDQVWVGGDTSTVVRGEVSFARVP